MNNRDLYQFYGCMGLSGMKLKERHQFSRRVHRERRPGETLADCQRRIG